MSRSPIAIMPAKKRVVKIKRLSPYGAGGLYVTIALVNAKG